MRRRGTAPPERDSIPRLPGDGRQDDAGRLADDTADEGHLGSGEAGTRTARAPGAFAASVGDPLERSGDGSPTSPGGPLRFGWRRPAETQRLDPQGSHGAPDRLGHYLSLVDCARADRAE